MFEACSLLYYSTGTTHKRNEIIANRQNKLLFKSILELNSKKIWSGWTSILTTNTFGHNMPYDFLDFVRRKKSLKSSSMAKYHFGSKYWTGITVLALSVAACWKQWHTEWKDEGMVTNERRKNMFPVIARTMKWEVSCLKWVSVTMLTAKIL